jgi:hypothetical protein
LFADARAVWAAEASKKSAFCKEKENSMALTHPLPSWQFWRWGALHPFFCCKKKGRLLEEEEGTKKFVWQD